METLVLLENVVPVVLKEKVDPQAAEDLQGLQVKRDVMVPLGQMASLGPQASQETRALLEILAKLV